MGFNLTCSPVLTLPDYFPSSHPSVSLSHPQAVIDAAHQKHMHVVVICRPGFTSPSTLSCADLIMDWDRFIALNGPSARNVDVPLAPEVCQ